MGSLTFGHPVCGAFATPDLLWLSPYLSLLILLAIFSSQFERALWLELHNTVNTAYSVIGYSAKSDIVSTLGW